MIKVTLKVKDNSLYGEVVNFEANFSNDIKLKEVKKWIDRLLGDGDELLNTHIGLVT